LPGLSRHARKPLGPEHDERDQADDEQFGETEIEHLGRLASGQRAVKTETGRRSGLAAAIRSATP
jgi:hypothetical protein